MKTMGWKAASMPQVFWAASIQEWGKSDPHMPEGIEAEVSLPDGSTAIVEQVRYQGTNGGAHHWQGKLKMLTTK